jgi:AAA15 family ATPase/GTPase
MLIQFSAKNTFSIKDKVVLSLLASTDKEHSAHLIDLDDPKKKCLKATVIYGANASGKSNVINAFWYMVDFVMNSHEKQLGRPTGRVPFRFDKKCPSEPSSFEVVFVQDGIR